MHRRSFLSTAALGGLLGLAGVPTTAQASAQGTHHDAAIGGQTQGFPTTFPLPDGFQPEGIAIGPGPVAYFGSRLDGSLYEASLESGRGRILSTGPGTPSLGLKTDADRIFVSGGSGGDGRVVDRRTGEVLASYQFATGASFVNDVVLTGDAAWFTDSTNPVLYQLPLHRRRLPSADEVVRLPLSGDIVFGEGINTNGLVRTPDRGALLVVHSSAGMLFRVDPSTGATTTVDLGGEVLTNGDGLLLRGHTLYAVQNRLNTIAVLCLNSRGTRARVVDRLTDERFDVPTTVAAYGDRLYLPNARFTTPPEPTTPYAVVAIPVSPVG
jgi:sugar lactone lactonase YvrE